MYAYGVGSTVDLPNFSVMVVGLDGWDETHQQLVSEPRLLDAVRAELGAQVEHLKGAPWLEETRNAFDEWAWTGVPVTPFPRWLRCPRPNCNVLAPIESGLFELKSHAYRPDLTRYVHQNCTSRGRPPTALPARFIVACPRGHLDEFPWVRFAHWEQPCTGKPRLIAYETGSGARSTDLQIECQECGQRRHLSHAFGERSLSTMPRCRGRHPHLGVFQEGCAERVRAMLLGASNSWFPITMAALSLPVGSDPLEEQVAQHWDVLRDIDSMSALEFALKFVPALKGLKDVDHQVLWAAVQAHAEGPAVPIGEVDLLGPEWDLLRKPGAVQSRDFRVDAAAVPAAYRDRVASVGLVSRLREVVAMTGFTRVDAPDSGVASDTTIRDSVPLSRVAPAWVPAAEVRGEGIFIELPEPAVRAWEDRVGGSTVIETLHEHHRQWRQRRNLDPAGGWPGDRYLLLHTLSHALIGALSLEAGYAAASIRERIYARDAGPQASMAGILLYTAATDSEGTLGGLVRLGRPEHLGRMLDIALDRSRLCSSDPICANRFADVEDETLSGAACHACLFVPETSCERGNRFLDRALLVRTLNDAGVAYFAES